jgi:hypothetical protein
MNWTDIAFQPDADTAREATEAWDWLIGEPCTFLLSSMFGGLFLEKQSGGVFWLECGTGLIERVAEDAASFDRFLCGERTEAWGECVDAWFLPRFVEELHAAAKKPGPDQCYGMTILPIFEGGRYEVENAYVVQRREWVGYTGSMHHQIRDLPDGAKVQIVVAP